MTITRPRLRFRKRGPNSSNGQELAFAVLLQRVLHLNFCGIGSGLRLLLAENHSLDRSAQVCVNGRVGEPTSGVRDCACSIS